MNFKGLAIGSFTASVALPCIICVTADNNVDGNIWLSQSTPRSPEISRDDHSLGVETPWSLLATKASNPFGEVSLNSLAASSQQVANEVINSEAASVDTPWSLVTKRATLMRRTDGRSNLGVDTLWPAALAVIDSKGEAKVRHAAPSYDPIYNVIKSIGGHEANLKPEVDGSYIGVSCNDTATEGPLQGCWTSLNCYRYTDHEGVNGCQYHCNRDPDCRGFNQVRDPAYQMQGQCCFAGGSVPDGSTPNNFATWWTKNCSTITTGSTLTTPTLAEFKACQVPEPGNAAHEAAFWANQDIMVSQNKTDHLDLTIR